MKNSYLEEFYYVYLIYFSIRVVMNGLRTRVAEPIAMQTVEKGLSQSIMIVPTVCSHL
jgi:hypothetical protein